MIIRRETLKALLPITANEDSRYFLQAIQVQPDGRIMATDGHLLLVATDAHPGVDEDFPCSPGTEPFTASPTGSVLIGREIVERILAAMPKKQQRYGRMPILETAQLAQGAGDATITATDLTASCRIYLPQDDTRFPQVQQILDKLQDRPEVTVHLGVPVLELLIKAAKAIGTTTIALRVSTDPATQGNLPLDHGFIFNGAASCVDDETTCDHEGCRRTKGKHTGGPNGVTVAEVGVQMAKDGITLSGVAMPCKAT